MMSVTDLPGGNPALPPEAFVSYIREHGLTPLAHLSGKDGNRAFIESRLYGLARMGAESILTLTGDAPKDGFRSSEAGLRSGLGAHPTADQAMREGMTYQMGPRTIRSTPFDFLPGAVVSPFKTTEAGQMMQLYKLELKLAAGARFIITQLGYNLRKLYELKQYLNRSGLGRVPVVANVYVPTATVAKMMRDGEVAGCVIPEELIRRLEKDKKPERLERAALMVAAARDLGFAGAHVGGFRLSHADVVAIRARSLEIGADWRGRLDELVFPVPVSSTSSRRAPTGSATATARCRPSSSKPSRPGAQWVSENFHQHVISRAIVGRAVPESPPGRWPEDGRRPGVAPRRVVWPDRPLHVPEGDDGLPELRRLRPGSSELRGLHHAMVLQAAAQRSLRRIPRRRHVRVPSGATLLLDRDLQRDAGLGEGIRGGSPPR